MRRVALLASALLVVVAVAPGATSRAAWTAATTSTGTFSTTSTFIQPLYSWGYAASGRTGVVPQTTITSPVRGVGLERFKAVASGKDSTCMLTDTGTA